MSLLDQPVLFPQAGFEALSPGRSLRLATFGFASPVTLEIRPDAKSITFLAS